MIRLLVVFLPVLLIAGLVLWFWAVRDAFARHPDRFATFTRATWLTINLLIPVLGAALYWAIGRVEDRTTR